MALSFSNQTARDILDGWRAQFDGGQIELRDGTQPASADDAATGTVLATILLPSPTFPAAVDAAPGATITANAIAQVLGVAAGTATWGRVYKSGGATVICDVTVGVELIISNPVIAIGSTVDTNSFVITQPES